MKKTQAVIDAEKAFDTLEEMIKVAKETVTELESKRSAAYEARQAAREGADSVFPQCRLVEVNRSGEESGGRKMVIVRRTPTGILVVRGLGDEYESRFKQNSDGVYVSAKRNPFYSYNWVELRDVPQEYLTTKG
jgi:hypothetical protein